MPARQAGFTLFEVLVTLAIMALIMVGLYTVLYANLDSRDQLELEARAGRLGPTVLDILEEDLRSLWITNIEEDEVFLGEDHTLNGEAADSLVFLTSVDSTLMRRSSDRDLPSDVCETGYRLRRNPALPDVLELWRRQSFHVDEEPLEQGSYELLHERVVAFQVRYLEELDTEEEYVDAWDTTKTHRLPALVSIELVVEVGPRGERTAGASSGSDAVLTERFVRVVPLRARSDLVMRIHTIPPGFVPLSESGGGGGGGGEDPDGDDDGDGIPNKEEEGGEGGEGGEENPDPFGTGGKPGGSGGDDLSDLLEDLFEGAGGG